MPNIEYQRHGVMGAFHLPASVPPELDAYKFPKAVRDKLTASDNAWEAVDNALMTWEAAKGELEHVAGQADKDLLITAIRAGEGDPGTPNQDAARRGEEVAFVALEVAVTDANPIMQAAVDAVTEYVADHEADLAAFEVTRWDQAKALEQDVADAIARLDAARHNVGQAYVNARWFAGQRFAPELYMLASWETRNHGNDEIARDNLEAASENRQPGVVLTGTAGKF